MIDRLRRVLAALWYGVLLFLLAPFFLIGICVFVYVLVSASRRVCDDEPTDDKTTGDVPTVWHPTPEGLDRADRAMNDGISHVFAPGALVCNCGVMIREGASLTAPAGWPTVPSGLRCGDLAARVDRRHPAARYRRDGVKPTSESQP